MDSIIKERRGDMEDQERLLRLKERVKLASGRGKVELVLHGGRVVNVFNGKIEEKSIAIHKGKIIGLGAYEGESEVDLKGAYVVPGLIDAHMHMESTLVTPDQMARILVPRGTTTVVADPHEIANVCGLEGVRYMIEAAEKTPLNGFFMLPSCVPSTPFENAGAVLKASDLKQMMHHDKVLGLGELMNYPGAISGDDEVMEKVNLFKEGIIDGHGPELTGKALNAYAINGVQTEHECTTVAEMEERLGLGMYISIREGSAARNLETLIRGVNDKNAHMCLFCTDDKHPEDILTQGHIDYNVRKAIQLGIDPIRAIQMATINTARCYRLKDIGAIAPGYDADLVIVNDLNIFDIKAVYKTGKLVAKNKKALFEVEKVPTESVENTIKCEKITPEQLRLSLKGDVVNVIRITPGSIVTEHVVRRVYQDEKGDFVANQKLDVVKIAVIERHGKTHNIGIGLVENFNLKNGAIATSIAHDSHNIIAIGSNDADMSLAVNRLIEMDGGIVVTSEGKVQSELALKVAGLMSVEPMEKVNEALLALRESAHDQLCIPRHIEPFMTLSFLALPVIPELKITDQGYFDVTHFQKIAVEVE